MSADQEQVGCERTPMMRMAGIAGIAGDCRESKLKKQTLPRINADERGCSNNGA
jgi:hypothetical protein